MENHSYHYCVDDYNDSDGFEGSCRFTSTWSNDNLEYIAEDAAEHYWDEKDGWESKWPRIFTIYSPDGTMLGRVEIEMEYRTHFSGRELENVPTETPQPG